MGPKWLKLINLLMVPVILIIPVLFWIFVPREQFMWGIILVMLIVMLVLYLNIRKPIMDHIKSGRAPDNKPADPKIEKLLKIFNYFTLVVVLVMGAFALFAWFMLSKVYFFWIFILILMALFGVSLVNMIAGIRNVQRLKAFTFFAIVVIVVIGLTAWTMFPRDHFMWAAIFIVPSLLLVWLINFSKVILNIS